MAAPIRVGFIGLSSVQNAAWTGKWAANAHLPYLNGTTLYEVTALCNSSLQSAERAIKLHGLDPSKVKAYGDPQSLAQDGNVDMVVCSVNVKQHYDLIKPALLAGKMVYCEWPLGCNLRQMEELAAIAKENKLKTVVGMQGRLGAYVKAIQNLIGDGDGRIGRVLSTSLRNTPGALGQFIPQDLAHLADIRAGGNLVTISLIQTVDIITTTLGGIKSSTTMLRNQRPVLTLLDHNNQNVIDPNFPNNTPDHIYIHGLFEGDIAFTFNFRGGPGFPDAPGLEWHLYGERGEIRLTQKSVALWTDPGAKIEVHDFATGSIREVTYEDALGPEDPAKGMKAPVDNIARLYDAFAKGEVEKYLDFEGSLKWARFIDAAYQANGF